MSGGGGGGGTPMAGTGGGSQVPQPGYERMTDYSMGFGRILQQPSFLNPFMGAYGFGQPFGGFGGGFGGGFQQPSYGGFQTPQYGGGYDPFGGYGGGYQSGIGGLFGGYSPNPFGGYNPFTGGNAYARPMPMPQPDFPSVGRPIPYNNPNEVVYDALGQPGYRNRELTPEERAMGRAAIRSGAFSAI